MVSLIGHKTNQAPSYLKFTSPHCFENFLSPKIKPRFGDSIPLLKIGRTNYVINVCILLLQIHTIVNRVISIYFECCWTQNSKKDTSLRKAISPSKWLCLTIHCLIYDNSQQDLSFTYGIGCSTVSMIICETCEVIWVRLSEQYWRSPQNKAKETNS